MEGCTVQGWTSTFQLNTGSGLPLTPVYFAAAKGTGITGNFETDVTGNFGQERASRTVPESAAYRIPDPGRWGNAGRTRSPGPAQFSLNSSLAAVSSGATATASNSASTP